MSSPYARGTNQHKSKRKVKVLFRWIIVLAVIVAIAKYGVLNPVKHVIDQYSAKTEVTSQQKDICAGSAACQAKIENLAAQTLLQEEIKKVRNEYEAKLADLEGRLAEKKAEALSLK